MSLGSWDISPPLQVARDGHSVSSDIASGHCPSTCTSAPCTCTLHLLALPSLLPGPTIPFRTAPPTSPLSAPPLPVLQPRLSTVPGNLSSGKCSIRQPTNVQCSARQCHTPPCPPHTLCYAAGCRVAPAPELLRRQANHTSRERGAGSREQGAESADQERPAETSACPLACP